MLKGPVAATLLAALITMALPKGAAANPPGNAANIAGGVLGQWATHPGLFVTAERPALYGKNHALFLGARLGAYTHPGNHHALFMLGDANYRATLNSGLQCELGLGLGGLQSMVAGPVYTVPGDAVTQNRDPGRTALLPDVGIGLGWDFARSHGWPWRVFMRADAFARLFVNDSAVPGFFISLGVARSLDWGASL
jgi:hypothetical protein